MTRRSGKYLLLAAVVVLVGGLVITSVTAQAAGYSLRFYGTGTGDIDRVKIPVDPTNSADVGGSFTIEFFIRVIPGQNGSGACTTGNAGWTSGNTIVDRDVFGTGDFGDYGISLFGLSGVIAFGVSDAVSGETVCGTRSVIDGSWHHIAVTRNAATGVLALFVDGVPDGIATGPTGDISYRDGRATTWPNDPFLVLGAEKHDFGPAFPSYSGWFDELRISTTIRYTGAFIPPTQPFLTDTSTVLLYHFDEGTGNLVADSSGNGTDGVRRPGGSPVGPEWSTETPFTTLPPPTLPTTPPSGGTPIPPSTGGGASSSGTGASVSSVPLVPLCVDLPASANSVIQTQVSSQHFEIRCRLLVLNSQYHQESRPANIGNQSVIDAGIIHAVDVFSPTGLKSFEAGLVICFQGAGQLVFLGSNEAPRGVRLLASANLYAGFTCSVLSEPGTVVLTINTPA